MKKYLVVATKEELSLPWAVALSPLGSLGVDEVIVTGVGGANVIRSLEGIPRDSEVINVGWCGSACYPVGAVLDIGSTRLWHPNASLFGVVEETFVLGRHETICLTAGDFVTDQGDAPGHSVFDMELAYIAAFGFASIRSIKYVSDKLNMAQYENTVKNSQ